MLLYDLTALQGIGKIQIHGGGKYAEIVFHALCKSGTKMVAVWDSRRWMSKQVNSLCNDFQIELIDYASNSIDSIVKRYHVDCIYSALPNDEILSYHDCRVIATLHGLRSLEMPLDWILLSYPNTIGKKIKFVLKKFLPQKYIRKDSMRYYHHFFENEMLNIVTVSNHTKYAIASFFPEVDMEKVQVFYSPSTSFPVYAEKKDISEKYFLIVSAVRKEKNALRAIMAFDHLVSVGKLKNFRMKLTGVDGNIFNYKIKNPNHFDFCGYVSEDELNSLYANAYAFVYPSYTEGFGYPPLEAMRYGVPVLASPFTSICEVCGDAALYFNPCSIEEMMNRMMMMTDNVIYEQLVDRSRKRYNIITEKQTKDLRDLVSYIQSFD